MKSSGAKKNVIFDSNIWIAYHLEDDIFHFEAKRIISRYFSRNYQIVIPTIVIYETCNVIAQYSNSPNIIRSFLKLIDHTKSCKIIDLTTPELIFFLEKYSAKLNLKTLDFLIFCYYAKVKPNQFITYDKKLLNITNKFSHEKENI